MTFTDSTSTSTSPSTDRRDDLVVLVGNPRPRSRTRTAAEAVARRLADRAGLRGTPRTIDLADLAGQLLLAEAPDVDAALRTVAAAPFAVVATPVYKASYTGLLKAFLDRYGPRGLAGVTAVPLVVSASPDHSRAGDDHLRPLLVELGARVPDSSLALLETQLPDVDVVADAWLDAWSDAWPPGAAWPDASLPEVPLPVAGVPEAVR
ncbi:NAD(P)H-dependent oxidoreductase [Isoptericola hypogeus]|uniref:NAD(P)H-dependent oxidoreductase n=1 Tax=Isoptericola hypogeus TaxID=300179 RepID=A0ABP4VE93_9MICO